MTDIFIRKENPADFEAIKEVNNLAFSQKQEGELIENLRKKSEFVPELSLVAIHEKNILGHPEYYPRFGFRKASDWKIKEPFGVPDEIMMAIELKEGGLGFGGGMIDFPGEYYAAM